MGVFLQSREIVFSVLIEMIAVYIKLFLALQVN